METVVNYDYKQWYIFTTVVKKLDELKQNERILCLGTFNPYLDEFLNEYGIEHHFIDDIKQVKDAELLIILQDINTEQLNTIINHFPKKIVDCYSEFKSYLLSKTPMMYVVNDFKSTDNGSNYRDYILEKDAISRGYIEKYIKKCKSNNQLALFNKVEIETINCCNGECSFCPINRKANTRKIKIMNEGIFIKIIDELKDINYSGSLALFGNNEPLLDKRLPKLALYAKNNLPDAFLYIYTNGTLLTLPILQTLLASLDYIYIDNYNTKPELIPELKNVYEYLCTHQEFRDKVSIHLRNSKEILSSRGGQSPNKSEIDYIHSNCILPYSQFNIKSNGDVSICCNDALGKYIVGNVANQSILEIWHNPQYTRFRDNLLNGRVHSPCRECDFIFTPLPFEKTH